jgi:hypothetical protein
MRMLEGIYTFESPRAKIKSLRAETEIKNSYLPHQDPAKQQHRDLLMARTQAQKQ